jgi:hypothetical protein
MKSFDLAQQPRKGIFLAYQILTTILIRLPLWTLSSIVPAWRARPSWSFKKNLLIKIFRHSVYVNERYQQLFISFMYFN